ncbi:MAG: hypothetical protein AAF614_37835 [Chloroflexota bacterium]
MLARHHFPQVSEVGKKTAVFPALARRTGGTGAKIAHPSSSNRLAPVSPRALTTRGRDNREQTITAAKSAFPIVPPLPISTNSF